MKYFNKIVKWTVLILLVLMFAALGVRMLISREPAVVRKFITSGGADPAGERIQTSSPSTNYSDGGLFFVTSVEYQEESGEWQVVVRYNHSTLRSIADEMGVAEDELPDEPFSYTLSDDRGNVYSPYASVSASATLHDFRRLAFSGVDVNQVQKLILTVSYNGDTGTESAVCGEIMIWGYYYGSST